MTGEEILRTSRPEKLFSGELALAKHQYLSYVKTWHPDRHGGDKFASDVLAQINVLYDDAVRRITDGTWGGKSSFRFDLSDGKHVDVQYHVSRPFELGQMYIADTHVTFAVAKEHTDLFENAVNRIKGLTYANDKMRAEISRCIPSEIKTLIGVDGRRFLYIRKTPDLLPLRDVYEHLRLHPDGFDERHAAWIGSSLHNLACYFSWAKLVHHDISLDTYFISPKHHGGALLGGWWYSKSVEQSVSVVPRRTHDYLPWDVRKDKRASFLTDQELVRATVRELLGDATGASLKKCELTDWLKQSASGSAVNLYKEWYAVLKKKFGERRFTKLELVADQLYER